MTAAGPGLDLPDHKESPVSGKDCLFKMLLHWINLQSHSVGEHDTCTNILTFFASCFTMHSFMLICPLKHNGQCDYLEMNGNVNSKCFYSLIFLLLLVTDSINLWSYMLLKICSS